MEVAAAVKRRFSDGYVTRRDDREGEDEPKRVVWGGVDQWRQKVLG